MFYKSSYKVSKQSGSRRRRRLQILNKFVKKLKTFQSSWKIYVGNKKIPQQYPAKIISAMLPQMPDISGNIPVHVTKGNRILYDNSAPIVKMNASEFIAYSGSMNLSVVQLEIKQPVPPPLVALNLKSIEKCNLWYYKGDRLTNWHYDGHDNFLFQLRGTKQVFLSPPNSLRCLSVFSVNNNQATTTTYKGYFRITIRPGECLYIPKGWFHRVKSQGSPSIALNYWGNSLLRLGSYEYDAAFRYLASEISQRQVKNMIDRLLKQSEDARRKQRLINNTPFTSIKQQMLQSPIDYELLSRKLDQNTDYKDLSQLWLNISYKQFMQRREESRRQLFMNYMAKIL